MKIINYIAMIMFYSLPLIAGDFKNKPASPILASTPSAKASLPKQSNVASTKEEPISINSDKEAGDAFANALKRFAALKEKGQLQEFMDFCKNKKSDRVDSDSDSDF